VWHQMFDLSVPVGEKLLRTVLVYALIVVLIRVTGKRGLAAMNTLDIVVVILLSNVVQNAIIGNDNSVTGGAIGAVTIVAVDSLLNRLARSNETIARLFDGTETIVIDDGEVVERAMRRLALRRSELDHAVRLQDGNDVSEVASGALEPGGQLVLTLKPSEQAATKGDVERLQAQLDRIEAALAARAG
jgi:uncharacterized membrane protein YcaP (DUF421 family)